MAEQKKKVRKRIYNPVTGNTTSLDRERQKRGEEDR